MALLSLKPEFITSRFKKCAFLNAIDGSENLLVEIRGVPQYKLTPPPASASQPRAPSPSSPSTLSSSSSSSTSSSFSSSSSSSPHFSSFKASLSAFPGPAKKVKGFRKLKYVEAVSTRPDDSIDYDSDDYQDDQKKREADEKKLDAIKRQEYRALRDKVGRLSPGDEDDSDSDSDYNRFLHFAYIFFRPLLPAKRTLQATTMVGSTSTHPR